MTREQAIKEIAESITDVGHDPRPTVEYLAHAPDDEVWRLHVMWCEPKFVY